MFERMEKKLSSGLSSDWQRPSLAPAFVLWAADWFRRSYQGGVQRLADIEKVLGLHLSQGDWRDLADQGFRAWGVEPLITAHGNPRLSHLAPQGGSPAAAMASGARWNRKFTALAVSELLGADM